MTVEELTEGNHSITGVKVMQDGPAVIVRCPCGWTSRPFATTRQATAEWQHHRDGVIEDQLGVPSRP